jgi:cytochrome c
MKARAWIAAAGMATFAAALAAPAYADEAGEKMLKDKGCTACHANDKKLVGPAYKEVAKKYKGDAGAAGKLAEKVIKGGQGVWGPVPMPPNKVSDDDAKKMVATILAM